MLEGVRQFGGIKFGGFGFCECEALRCAKDFLVLGCGAGILDGRLRQNIVESG